MVTQDTGPGYAYQLQKGATTLTEAWDTNPASSQNHCMLGHAEEWFYRGLGGISPAAPGFRKITIRPAVVKDLASAQATYESVQGKIRCAWRRANERVTLDVEVPVGAEAIVHVPAKGIEAVTESGRPVAQAETVEFLKMENGAAVFLVGSGDYSFAAPDGAPTPADGAVRGTHPTNTAWPASRRVRTAHRLYGMAGLHE